MFSLAMVTTAKGKGEHALFPISSGWKNRPSLAIKRYQVKGGYSMVISYQSDLETQIQREEM